MAGASSCSSAIQAGLHWWAAVLVDLFRSGSPGRGRLLRALGWESHAQEGEAGEGEADGADPGRPPLLWRSEDWARQALGYLLLVALPPFLMLGVIASKYEGLSGPQAFDIAQLARHLAHGDGFATSLVRPLSLSVVGSYYHQPDLYHAPAYPFALSLAFRLFQPSDRVTAAFGALLWTLSVWLTFLVARRWFGGGVGGIAALFYGGTMMGVASAVQSACQPLLALIVLAVAALAFPRLQEEGSEQGEGAESPTSRQEMQEQKNDREEHAKPEEDHLPAPSPAGELPVWTLVAIGAGCALAILTHYLMLGLAWVMAVYLLISHARKARALGCFLAGLLVPLLPWMARNAHLTGSPFFSLYWYEFLADTATYPGESLWRTTGALAPAAFLLEHPGDLLRKFLIRLDQLWTNGPVTLNPIVGFLFLSALFSGAGSLRQRRLRGLTAAGLTLVGLGVCLFRFELPLLTAWQPLVAIGAAAHLADRVHRWFHPEPLTGLAPPGCWLAPVYLGASGLALVPLGLFMAVYSPLPSSPVLQAQSHALMGLLGPEAVVMTDQPAGIAWYGERQAVWLPQREEDWMALEQSVGPVDAILVTGELNRLSPAERGDWWFWLTTPAGIYRHYVPAPNSPPGAVLRVRRQREETGQPGTDRFGAKGVTR